MLLILISRVVKRRVPLIAHNVLVHGSECRVLLLELVVSLRWLEGGKAAWQEGPGVNWLVTLLSQALLRLGGQCLVIEPRLLRLSHGQRRRLLLLEQAIPWWPLLTLLVYVSGRRLRLVLLLGLGRPLQHPNDRHVRQLHVGLDHLAHRVPRLL